MLKAYYSVPMPEFSGPESAAPGEDGGNVSEQVSEQAKERFAQAIAQNKQQARDEKKARKRDDRVAATIRQFLSDERYSHLFQLISRLAARDCPSVFILAMLSLIHDGAREAVEEYIVEQKILLDVPKTPKNFSNDNHELPENIQSEIVLWISRLSLVMSIDTEKILSKLMVDEGNIDGTVLQLATFVLVDFFDNNNRPVPYDQLQPLTIKILQDVIQPHMDVMEAYFARLKMEQGGNDDE